MTNKSDGCCGKSNLRSTNLFSVFDYLVNSCVSWLVNWLAAHMVSYVVCCTPTAEPECDRRTAKKYTLFPPASWHHSLQTYTLLASKVNSRSWYPSFSNINATNGLLQFAKWPGGSGPKRHNCRHLYSSAQSSIHLLALVPAFCSSHNSNAFIDFR